jgi:hypothetical protein
LEYGSLPGCGNAALTYSFKTLEKFPVVGQSFT